MTATLNIIKKEKLLDLLFAAMPFAFILPTKWTNIILVFFMLTTLVCFKRGVGNKNSRYDLLLPVVPFLIALAGFFIDLVGGYKIPLAWSSFESYLPLLFFPAILFCNDITPDRVTLSKKGFLAGCLVIGLVCLAIAIYKNITDHDRMVHNWNFVETLKFYEENPIGIVNWGFFLYSEFSEATGFHPIYLSVYFLVATTFAFSFLMSATSLRHKILYGVVIIFLSIEILMLSGRLPLLILLMMVGGLILWLLLGKTEGKRKYIAVCFLALLFVVPLLVPSTIYRIRAAYAQLVSVDELNTDYTNAFHRLTIWKRTLELIADDPVTGHGLLGSKLALDPKYESGKLSFNSHNQYLMFALATGVFGGLVFIITLCGYSLRAISRRDRIYLIFLGIMIMVFLTENFITRQKGVILFSFFNSLFYMNKFNERGDEV